MTDRTRKVLGALKARQDTGEHMSCPRCGRDTMKACIHTNALSRHADIYICDACGTEEALLKFMHNPLPMREWACFRPTHLPSDFKTLPAAEVWERVQEAHISFLLRLYECWQNEHEYEDFDAYRAAAFENCPGLTQLWERPFRAEYATADGKLVLRFRLTDEGIEVAADITKSPDFICKRPSGRFSFCHTRRRLPLFRARIGSCCHCPSRFKSPTRGQTGKEKAAP